MYHLPEGELRINGRKIGTEKTLPSINPSTEEKLGEFCAAGKEDVDSAVTSAREAFNLWRTVPLTTRISYVSKYRRLALKKIDEMVRLSAAETGRAMTACLSEIISSIMIAKYYELFAEKFISDEKISTYFDINNGIGIRKAYRTFDPLGVAAIICPWGYPVYFPAVAIIPSIIAGNTMVLKPSEKAAFTGIMLYEIFEEAGLPPGVLNVVNGGEGTGSYLAQSKIDKIFFTGSHKVGQRVLKNSYENIVPALLTLGGVDSMIVLKDADVEETANALVYGAFFNSGQTYVAAKRILAAKEIKKKLLRQILIRVKKIKVGEPCDFDIDLGPMISREELERFENLIKEAVSKGARVEFGGKAMKRKGYFFEPTVLTNLNMGMELAYKDVYGPLIGIFEFENEEEAVAAANYPNFALNISIWSRDKKRAQRLAREARCGIIKINDVLVQTGYEPFGGGKQSGFGRILAMDGLRAATNKKIIDVPIFYLKNILPKIPNSQHLFNANINLIKFLGGGSFKSLFYFIKGLFQLKREFRRFNS